MSSPLDWFPFRFKAHLAGFRHLGLAEHGAYLLLLCSYWETGKLPSDDERLARIVGVPVKEWLKLRPAMQEIFGDDFRNAEIEAEINDAAQRYDRQSKA